MSPYKVVEALGKGLPGFAATFVGIGLGRFSFTPLVPLLVDEGVLSSVTAARVAAVLLLGYTCGALIAAPVGARLGMAATIRAAFVATILALGLEVLALGATGHMVARFVTGLTGGVLMVLGPATVLRAVRDSARPAVAGMVYGGIGLGIAFSGIVVPALAGAGSDKVALLLTVCGLGVAALGWRGWPDAPPAAAAPRKRGLPLVLVPVAAAYGLDALGYIPHTVYWSDFVASELGRGVAAGGGQWVLFGIGALLGAPLAGITAGRLGFRRAFVVALALKALFVAVPAVTAAPAALVVSSVAVGVLVPGIVALASGCVAEVSDPHHLAGRWGLVTAAFAVAQAGGGILHAGLYGMLGSYRPLFAVAATLLAVAAGVAALGRSSATSKTRKAES